MVGSIATTSATAWTCRVEISTYTLSIGYASQSQVPQHSLRVWGEWVMENDNVIEVCHGQGWFCEPFEARVMVWSSANLQYKTVLSDV